MCVWRGCSGTWRWLTLSLWTASAILSILGGGMDGPRSTGTPSHTSASWLLYPPCLGHSLWTHLLWQIPPAVSGPPNQSGARSDSVWVSGLHIQKGLSKCHRTGRRQEVRCEQMCGCRSYGHLPCFQWDGAALPGWGLPSLKGIVPPHPAARPTRTLQGWIVVTPTLDPVPETAHLEGYSSSPFCHLLLGKSLHFLESRSHPLSSGGSKAHTEACCTQGRSERLWAHSVWVWL